MHIIHNIHNIHNIYSIHNIMRGVETLGSDLYDQKMKPPGRFYLGVPGFIWFHLVSSQQDGTESAKCTIQQQYTRHSKD